MKKTKPKSRNHVLEFLKSGEFELIFEWVNKNTYGEINQRDKKIRINLALVLAKVSIHEYLHSEFPLASEAKIRTLTRKTVDGLSRLEILNIANFLMKEFLVQCKKAKMKLPHKRKRPKKVLKCFDLGVCSRIVSL